MKTETITLIISAATLFVTSWMLIYMKKSDRIKSKRERIQRNKELLNRIESKEKQLENMRLMSSLPGAYDKSDRQRMEDLEMEINQLRNMLYL